MHYELQTLVMCASNDKDCHERLLEAAKILEEKLKSSGAGFVVEVRDIRRGTRLSRSVDPGKIMGDIC